MRELLARTWREAVLTAIDFESAGATRGATDEPVQVGWAVLNGLEIPANSLFVSHLRPSRKVTWNASQIHGIKTEDLHSAPPLPELWPQVRAALGGRIVVAHGAGTEKRFLRAFPLHGFGPWLDTLPLARAILPQATAHSLADILTHFSLTAEVECLCPGRGWHDALFDATACLVFLRHVVQAAGCADEPVAQFFQADTAQYYAHRARQNIGKPR